MTDRSEFSVHRKAMLALGPLQNLKELLLRTVAANADDVVIVEKNGSEKVDYTASQLYADVRALGTFLSACGLVGQNIAILGENSYRWIVSFLAIVCSGAVAVPLDKESLDDELLFLLAKSNVKALFYSETFSALANRFDSESIEEPFVFLMQDKQEENAWDCLISKGNALLQAGCDCFDSHAVHDEDVAAIVFTSGTTGFHKGAMLTHRNFVSNINAIAENVPLASSTISVLPMNHMYELNCNILPMIYIHTVVCINDRMRNLMHNLRLFQPQMVVVVPLFLESFYNHIWQKLRKDGRDQKVARMIAVSNRLLENGIDMRRSFFKSIHAYFGSELSLLICGGAPVNQKYVKGLSELGFDIYVGYGLTEASPIAALNLQPCRYADSVGQAFANTKIYIHAPDDDGEGEIWLRGDNITPGYYKDEAATLDSFAGGWFKTGDYGKFSEDGYLLLTGRKKNLIILDNGKNVHPEEIEKLIRSELGYVREVVVMESEKEIFGCNQKIIAAVLYVDTDAFPDVSESQIEQIARGDMQLVNEKLPGYKTVSHVFITTDGFQKTSTKKILRGKVIEQYGAMNGRKINNKEGTL